jgi:hypothetical protein
MGHSMSDIYSHHGCEHGYGVEEDKCKIKSLICRCPHDLNACCNTCSGNCYRRGFKYHCKKNELEKAVEKMEKKSVLKRTEIGDFIQAGLENRNPKYLNYRIIAQMLEDSCKEVMELQRKLQESEEKRIKDSLLALRELASMSIYVMRLETHIERTEYRTEPLISCESCGEQAKDIHDIAHGPKCLAFKF